MIDFMKTETNLVIFWNGKTKVVPVGTPAYDEVTALIRCDANPKDIIDACDLGARVKLKCHSSGLFATDEDCNVWVGDTKVPRTLSDRIVDFVEQGLPFAPLIAFWNNCMLNPDPVARGDLYSFLQHNGHPVTEDGCFIAYKRVRDSFYDHYTGTINNSVGKKPSMPRSEVDCDPKNTCSRGLHVASLDYALDSYQSGSGRLITVKVNPRDVCAIPPDYNMTKMRTCGYEVLGIHEQDRKAISDSLVDDSLKPKCRKDYNDYVEEAKDEDVMTYDDLRQMARDAAKAAAAAKKTAPKVTKPNVATAADINRGWQNLRDAKGRFYRKYL
jgi:hypothetical protein